MAGKLTWITGTVAYACITIFFFVYYLRLHRSGHGGGLFAIRDRLGRVDTSLTLLIILLFSIFWFFTISEVMDELQKKKEEEKSSV